MDATFLEFCDIYLGEERDAILRAHGLLQGRYNYINDAYTYYADEISRDVTVDADDLVSLGLALANDPHGIAYSRWCADTDEVVVIGGETHRYRDVLAQMDRDIQEPLMDLWLHADASPQGIVDLYSDIHRAVFGFEFLSQGESK